MTELQERLQAQIATLALKQYGDQGLRLLWETQLELLCDCLTALSRSQPEEGSEREKAEREVFNIVHREGLDAEHVNIHGEPFTDADLKASGQDWGDAADKASLSRSPVEPIKATKDKT